MLFKKKKITGRIVRRLELRRFYFEKVSWHWKKLLFERPFDFGLGINPHTTIVGESGSGKSNACKLLVKELSSSGILITILDPNSDYLGIADSLHAEVYGASKTGINILEPDGMSEAERLGEIMHVFRKRLRLGYVQASLLRRCIRYTYWVMRKRGKVPDLRDLVYTTKVFERRADTREAKVLETIRERLLMALGDPQSKSADMSRIGRENSLFLVSELHTEEAQSIYMEALLRKVYSSMHITGHSSLKRLIVVDEARKLSGSRILGKLVAEGRKYGVGVMTISQRAKEMDRDMLSNSSLFISFYQREPAELNYVANFISGGNELNRFIEVKKAIRNLGVGEAIVLDSRHREPFIVRFSLSDTRQSSLPYLISTSAANGIRKEELLAKCSSLGFTENEIQGTIPKLLESGELKSHVIESSEVNGDWYITSPRNSAEHDLYVNLISRKLSESGIPNEVYNSSYGPDVISYKLGKRTAIEYETGSKSAEQMQEMLELRKRSYSGITVVVNDSYFGKYSEMDGVEYIKASSYFS